MTIDDDGLGVTIDFSVGVPTDEAPFDDMPEGVTDLTADVVPDGLFDDFGLLNFSLTILFDR